MQGKTEPLLHMLLRPVHQRPLKCSLQLRKCAHKRVRRSGGDALPLITLALLPRRRSEPESGRGRVQDVKVWAVRTGPRGDTYMLLQTGNDWEHGKVYLACKPLKGPNYLVQVRGLERLGSLLSDCFLTYRACST